jgi:uncharacterized protein (UPF0254 family)
MCEGGCTGSSSDDSLPPTLNFAMLSNEKIQDSVSHTTKLDPLHLDINLFLNTFYVSNSFVPNKSSIHTMFEHFTIDGKPLSLVNQFIEAYREENDKEVSPLVLIKSIRECSKYKDLGNLVHTVCLTRNEIAKYYEKQFFIKATLNISIILHSNILDTTIVLQLPCIVEMSLKQKISILRNNLRVAFQPIYDSFSPIDKLKNNYMIALIGEEETFKTDIEVSPLLTAEQKTKILESQSRIIRLSRGLLPGTPFEPETRMILESLNEQVASEVNLKGIGGRILGLHEVVLVTIKDYVEFKRAGYGLIWRHSLFAFGASSDVTTALVGAGEGCLDGAVAVVPTDLVDPETAELNEAVGCAAGATVGGTNVGNVVGSVTSSITNFF